jgi:hypothetical protein
VPARPQARSTIRDRSKDSLYPHSHFTEHLVGAFRKSPRERNFNYKTSSFSIRQLKNNNGFTLQQTTITRAKLRAATKDWHTRNGGSSSLAQSLVLSQSSRCLSTPGR